MPVLGMMTGVAKISSLQYLSTLPGEAFEP
jgi:hypothetical protein